MNGGKQRDWGFRYPPLLAIGVIAFLMIAVLPSSLILPQTNPATTLEYAPVPKGKDDNPPPGGNLSSLSLASSKTLQEEIEIPDPARQQQQQTAGRKRQASDKRCVGNPPRQTEDPLAPPCVAFFEGNNFGDTYQGVTGGEIRILYYLLGNFITGPTSRGTEHTPTSKYYDLAEPERDDDPIHIRGLRDMQRYFNERYQTYNRFVHFYAYYSSEGILNPDVVRAQAAENYERIKPFAVFAYVLANDIVYLEEMAKRGVLTFGSVAARPASFYRRFPGHAWGYLPSVEVQAKNFVNFLCTNVVGKPVSFSGNSGENGGARKLGLIYTTDPSWPGLRLFAQIVRDDVKQRCNGSFSTEGPTPVAYGEIAGTSPDYAYTNMADFRQKQVTTVVWAQGIETNQTKAASQLAYTPEWIVAGDRAFEGFDGGQKQDQSQWEHAWVVSSVTKYPKFDEDFCYLAYREANPRIPRTDALYMCVVMHVYEDQRQLFSGIQVAGPKLTPESINQGFHAIPALASTDPRLPSCYYEPDDYTCVKDNVSMWWDRQAQSPNARSPGCWRMPEGGKRYLNSWPAGNVDARKSGADPCNGYASSALESS